MQKAADLQEYEVMLSVKHVSHYSLIWSVSFVH